MTGVTEHGALYDLVGRLAAARVACFGDIMLDRWIYGRIERISPEAPIPVLRIERQAAMPGGAGNAVRNLVALGARVDGAFLTGIDSAAAELRRLVDGEDGARLLLIAEAGRTTTVKTRYVAVGQQMLRADEETILPPPDETAAALLDGASAMIDGTGAVLLSDYGKGIFLGGVAEALIARARHAGVAAIVDPKGRGWQRYRGASVITPNRAELAEGLGEALAPGEEAEAARALIQRYGFGAVLATLGRDGMLLVPADGPPLALPAKAREVFDVSGAGDTVAATLAAAVAVGATLADAAALANVAAGLVVGKVGTAVVHPWELVRALDAVDRVSSAGKHVPLAAAAERVARWRTEGLVVGFTNGCFDLLHPGHVSLLEQARAACDRLVVGLNTDASVARLKGPGRPLQGEAARATVLASLAAVDLVVSFEDDTPLALVQVLRPDVLVKGADYRLEDVVGAPEVRSWGGRVLLARLEPGFSTTETVSRLRRHPAPGSPGS